MFGPSLRPRCAAQAGLLLALFCVALAPARAESIRYDAMTIPAVSANFEALVVRPDDGSPHPLVIVNHGSPRDANARLGMTPYEMGSDAAVFARRGWTAVTFLRRGYGLWGGVWAETYGSCWDPDYVKAGFAGAADIAEVAQFMSTKPYVRKGDWISVGASAGGFATVALAATAPPGLAAAIAFAPGRGSSAPDVVCGESRLVAAFAKYGQTSRVPLLWVSARNDLFFGPALMKRSADAFSQGGAPLDFVEAPPFGDDGHGLFTPAGASVWAPIVDTFLAAHHLSQRERPIDPPDIAAPDGLSAGGKDAFRSYLANSPNKAFAIGAEGRVGWATGRASPEAASSAALSLCQGQTNVGCKVVNVNDKPVE